MILNEIPRRFFAALNLRRGIKHHPREIQYLLTEADVAARAGIEPFDYAARVRICRDVSFIYALLHKRQLVYGDLNASNVIVGVEPPSGLLVDCDGVREVGSAGVMEQLNTPDWMPPEGNGIQSIPTDLYKLGLLILRVLCPGPQASVSRDPNRATGVLDAEGVQLLRNALREGGPRTSAKQWYHYLGRCLGLPGQSQPIPSEPSLSDPCATQLSTTHPGWRRDPVTGRWERACP